MKSVILKRFTALLAVVILGGAGAFFTASMSKVNAVDERRVYRELNDEPCHEELVRCQTDFTTQICSYGSNQLFAKVNDENPNSDCNIPMYKVIE